MGGRSLTVAVLAGTDRQATRGFLALLSRSLEVGDHVVLSGKGHDPRAVRSWRSVGPRGLTHPSARPGLGEVVVVVDERAVPVGPWLPALAAALDVPGVSAAGARTNIAGGDELLVGVPYRSDEAERHRSFVREQAAANRGALSDAQWLSGPALALSKSTFTGAGGLQALVEEGALARYVAHAATVGRLVAADGAYLHHGGGPAPGDVAPTDWEVAARQGPVETDRAAVRGSAPLVSACIITKDEHANLPRLLGSIAGFCDEVVVYDTGSSDDTCAIARAHGAAVFEGYWDDDFARARNAALEHCSGQWILWVDADEELVCDDVAGVRRQLAEMTSDAEGLLVLIDNIRGNVAATSLSHPACRLFRRAYGHWDGRLHEQVVARAGTGKLATPLLNGLRLTHWGYLNATISERGKAERNIRSALGDLAGNSSLPWATRLVSLGRSHVLGGHFERGIALCRVALTAQPAAGIRRLALRTTIDGLVALGRVEEALVEVGRLQACLTMPSAAETQRGRLLLMLGRCEEALAAFDRVVEGLDDDGYEHTAEGIAIYRARALARLGRPSEAADVLLAGLRAGRGMDAHVGLLIEHLEAAGRPLYDLVSAVPADKEVAFLGQLVNLSPEMADRGLEAWWELRPSNAVLATVSALGHRLNLERRTAWSRRLRGQGLSHACPLVASLGAGSLGALDHLASAAVAASQFGDVRGHQALVALAASLDADGRAEGRRHLETVAPGAVDTFDELCGAVPVSHDSGELPARSAPGHAVLVVDRLVAGIRTMSLAATLAGFGHEVTLAHPQPAGQTEQLLMKRGIGVVGWTAADGDSAAGEFLARLCAQRRFDTVVLSRTAIDLTERVRGLLPRARVLVDADDSVVRHMGPERNDFGADLVLSSRVDARGRADKAVAGAMGVAVSAPQLYPTPNTVPESRRAGVVVVGDFRTASDTEATRWCTALASALSGLVDATGVAVIGDNQGHPMARALDGALVLGPLADPLAWLAGARVVVVAVRAGAAHWLSAAAMAGTPALVVPDGDPSELVAAVTALSNPAMRELWEKVAPAAVPSAQYQGPDPLAEQGHSRRDDLEPMEGPKALWWPGNTLVTRSLAALAARGVAGVAMAEGPGAGVIEVRHTEDGLSAPADGARRVVVVNWNFGNLPEEWLSPLRDVADEVWVPSNWAWEQAVASGVSAYQVHMVPPAVDTTVFDVEPPKDAPGTELLSTKKSTVLLFVGECSEAAGADLALEAYLSEFSADDDVCLVVAGGGGEFWPEMQAAAGASLHAEVELVEGPLSDVQRAALYRRAHVLVAPHRAQGPQPVLEAMACGLPAIVPDGRSYEDFCDEQTTWLVTARKAKVRASSVGKLGAAGEFSQLEADLTSLRAAMREAAGSPDRRLVKGAVGRGRVVERYSLEAVAEIAAGRLEAVLGGIEADGANPEATGAEPADKELVDAGLAATQPPALPGAGARASGDERPGSVCWYAPFYNHSGYGEEARGFLRGVGELGWQVAARPNGSKARSFVEALRETGTLDYLARAAARHSLQRPVVVVQHAPGSAALRMPGAAANVARTMFETDGLPNTWVDALSDLDEIWVPSHFNVETFSDAGVKAPLHVVPGGVDTSVFRPGLLPLELPDARGCVFLSVFEWSHRKAPDVLLGAWAEAFGPGDPVTLVLRCFPRGRFEGDVTAAVERLVGAELARIGVERADVAPIVVLGAPLGRADMPRLMAAADAYVGVSRGEGWGRPLHEAMACGLPTIGTRWSANLAFMDDDNSLLVDIDGLVPVDERMDVPFYRGQCWADPSTAHLTELLRKTARDPALRHRVGERAREDIVARWQWHHAAAAADARLRELARRSTQHATRVPDPPPVVGAAARGPATKVRWVGDFYGDHSLATVNRELCAALAGGSGTPAATVAVAPESTEEPPYPVDHAKVVADLRRAGEGLETGPSVEVRLSWPPNLAPATGPLVVAQPWEYGGLPDTLAAKLGEVADEVWAPTTWVRDCYVKSGLDPEKVVVVPLGVDTTTFRPDGGRLDLRTDKRFRFLFVGGALRRKGFDRLLDTYLECFGPDDDVCLVLKLFGAEGVYQYEALDERARAAAADPDVAAIEIVDDRLSKEEMAALYRSCDVLVHPYRGEGFGLPIAEAMATGLATIVTDYGAATDFCDDATSWLLPARLEAAEFTGYGPSSAGYWVAEPDPGALALALHSARADDRDCAVKGRAGRRRIVEHFTWRHSAELAKQRLIALAAGGKDAAA